MGGGRINYTESGYGGIHCIIIIIIIIERYASNIVWQIPPDNNDILRDPLLP